MCNNFLFYYCAPILWLPQLCDITRESRHRNCYVMESHGDILPGLNILVIFDALS